MKKSVFLLVIMAFFAYTAGNVNAKGDDTKLIKGCHPRLVLDKDEFRQLKKLVGGDDALGKLHNHLINVADASVANSERFESVIDAKGKYVARRALARLVSCAYAYKMTGGRQYRDKAIQDLTDVCSFEDWGPKSFLDVSEMATAVSIAYDWLYESLPKNLRAMIVTALKENALEASRGNNKYTWWYKRIGNWNQVCNSGLVCAAVAVYEHCPQLAQEVIVDAIRTNKVAVEGIYGPDGAYPEGPTYWGYGTIYEVLMLTVMDDIFGTDYGLSSSPGFLNTGDFLIFTRGPKNMSFNFADNGPRTNYAYPLYYFAYKRNEPSMLYGELPLINERSYTSSAHKALMILPIKYAMKMNLDGLTGPSRKFYSAQGNVPLMICRSGWNADDHYLGIKGGKGAELHGHMDAGMFVYYADGVRWAMDLGCESYNNIRPAFSRAGRKLFDMSQNSLRWRLFRMHSRQHNTLTVNDKDHNVAQKVEMTATENTASRMAATFNLTPLFDGDLEKAERTAALCDEKYLEVRDVLKAPADRPAHVRWTMLSEAKPEITPDGIVLTCRTLSRKLKTHGEMCLVKNCRAEEDRHAFVVGPRASGPNVFAFCESVKTMSDVGPHQRWAMGTLYDNQITDNLLAVQDGGNNGTGHGWRGTNFILWNCTAARLVCQSPWATGLNWCVGCIGARQPGRLKDRLDGEWISHGTPVSPASLYEWQLSDRQQKGIRLTQILL